MLQKLTVAIFMLFCMQGQAFAEADKADMEFSLISHKDTQNADKKIQTNTLTKGVYVTVTSGWTPYPKTATIVKEMLAAKGIKVVDRPEDADIGLQFRSDVMDLSEIESNEDAGINKEHAAAVVASAIFTGGVSLIGEMWHPSTKGKPLRATIGVGITSAPKVSGRGTLSGDDLMFVGSDFVYQSNKAGHAVTRAAFITVTAKFIENHFVFDAPKLEPEKTEPEKTVDVSNTESSVEIH